MPKEKKEAATTHAMGPRASSKRSYEVGRGKPPKATRFPKGKSGARRPASHLGCFGSSSMNATGYFTLATSCRCSIKRLMVPRQAPWVL
jgi:hypothetical protein